MEYPKNSQASPTLKKKINKNIWINLNEMEKKFSGK